MNILKRADLFKQRAYLLIGSTYKGSKSKQANTPFYGSWSGLILSVAMIVILISYLCSLILLMLDNRKDTLNEYTVMNPFDEEHGVFNLYRSNVLPTILVRENTHSKQRFDEFLQFVGKDFYEDETFISININELYRYI